MSAEALKNELTNPARPYLWEVVIPDPPSGTIDLWRLRCQTAAQPGRSFGSFLIPFKATGGIKYNGKLTYSHTLEMTFIENEDRETFEALYEWCQDIVHDSEGIGSGDAEIKRDIYITLLNTAGAINKTIKLIGCWPENVADNPLVSEEGTGGMPFTVTMAYDRWERE
jgi:hypothetical protein